MTKQIALRPATSEDIPLIIKWWNDPALMKWVGFPEGLHADSGKVEQSLRYYREPQRAFLLILTEWQQPIGEFCFEALDQTCFQFDIKIGEASYQRQGYATLAVQAGIDLLTAQYAPKKICLKVNAVNKPALALYQKCGFKKVAVLKDDWENQLGEKMSSICLEKTL